MSAVVYRGPCAFCGQRLQMDGENFTIRHAKPTCSKFDDLDALSFVIAHRRALGIPAHPLDHD